MKARQRKCIFLSAVAQARATLPSGHHSALLVDTMPLARQWPILKSASDLVQYPFNNPKKYLTPQSLVGSQNHKYWRTPLVPGTEWENCEVSWGNGDCGRFILIAVVSTPEAKAELENRERWQDFGRMHECGNQSIVVSTMPLRVARAGSEIFEPHNAALMRHAFDERTWQTMISRDPCDLAEIMAVKNALWSTSCRTVIEQRRHDWVLVVHADICVPLVSAENLREIFKSMVWARVRQQDSWREVHMLGVMLSSDDPILTTAAASHMDADEIAQLQPDCLITDAQATHKFCYKIGDIGDREAFSKGAILLHPQTAYFPQQNIIADEYWFSWLMTGLAAAAHCRQRAGAQAHADWSHRWLAGIFAVLPLAFAGEVGQETRGIKIGWSANT